MIYKISRILNFFLYFQRMLERTQKRQELLASTLSQMSQPTPNAPLPPSRPSRRTRLAELANQVDQWLSDDQNFKQSETISNSKVNLLKVMIVNCILSAIIYFRYDYYSFILCYIIISIILLI